MPITFSGLQSLFEGSSAPISFSTFYANNSSGRLTNGVSGIPNAGTSISMSQFVGKYKKLTPSDGVTCRLQDLTTGLYLDFDGNNNGVLNSTGTYLTFQRPAGLYDPNGYGAWALYSGSGTYAGNYMRHSGLIVHLNGFNQNNFDFSWIFQPVGSIHFTIYNYYGNGTYLDFNGTNVLADWTSRVWICSV
jgi:hypothetical protein